ncbi:MAG: hypothetical protein ABI413_17480 [Ktedonobacteraceae bacterium]
MRSTATIGRSPAYGRVNDPAAIGAAYHQRSRCTNWYNHSTSAPGARDGSYYLTDGLLSGGFLGQYTNDSSELVGWTTM